MRPVPRKLPADPEPIAVPFLASDLASIVADAIYPIRHASHA
jgi:hypothetical protein